MRWLWAAAGVVLILAVAWGWQWLDFGNQRYFVDQTYHHLTMRTLGAIPYGGADTGEVLETIKHIRAGDAESWYEAWLATADRVTALGQDTRDPTSRGRAYLRASSYYRTAEFLLLPDDTRRVAAWQRQTEVFYAGLGALGVRHEPIAVPYGEHSLRALYFPGGEGSADKPLIVVCGGFDSTLEELYFAVAAGALERGYSVLLYEGPGQGAALRDEGLTFVVDWERPTGAVLDAFLAAHPRPPHIVLVGMSMGGYLAPRAAAFDARIDGVVAFDVLFDVAAAARWQSSGSGLAEWLTGLGIDGVAELLMRLKMGTDPGLRWGLNNAMWVMGVSSPTEVLAAFAPYTLRDVAQRIRADVLILAGVEDHLVPLAQVEQFRTALTQARSVTAIVYDHESGGKEHCQDGATTLWQRDFFEWVLERFPVASADGQK
jgi:alpha-beta hydrolase superfamily lysophospholipase